MVAPAKPRAASSEQAVVRPSEQAERQEDNMPVPGAWLYEASSADRCGGFGFEVDPAGYSECQAGGSQVHCCVLDRAVVPLYDALCTPAREGLTVLEDMYDLQTKSVQEVEVPVGPSLLDYLHQRCNYYTNPLSEDWQSWLQRLPEGTRCLLLLPARALAWSVPRD